MARTKRKNLAAIAAALKDGDDNEEDDVAAEPEDEEKENSPHSAEEDEDPQQGNHLEVEFVEQRIVFLIPPLPSKPKIARRAKPKPVHQPQQIEESRFAPKKCLPTEMSIAAMISPAAPISIPRNEAQLSIAMRHRDIGRLNFVRKRLQRSGGLSLWLRSKGLEQFVQIFQDQRIDEVKLVNLTMDALKQIGVLPVGPRRKLIAAIQQLCIA